jgi:hypothetical protein
MEVSHFTPLPVNLGEGFPGTHWVGPTAGLDAVEKGKISTPARYRTPVVQPVVSSLSWLSCPGSWYTGL